MSKDFEKSYRELAKSEAPDLWDRIESGLSRQSTRGQAEEEKRTETAPKEKGVPGKFCMVFIDIHLWRRP